MEFKLNASEIRDASKKLKSQALEIETAIRASESTFAPLRHHISKRLQRSMENWDTIEAQFLNNLHELISATDELSSAADAFEMADN
jgi:uncharacterized protein YukE